MKYFRRMFFHAGKRIAQAVQSHNYYDDRRRVQIH